jgi:hypothetical protein
MMRMDVKNMMAVLLMIFLMEKGSTQPLGRFTVEFLKKDS